MVRIHLALAAALVLFSAGWVAAPTTAFAQCSGESTEDGGCTTLPTPDTSESGEGGSDVGGGSSGGGSEPSEQGGG